MKNALQKALIVAVMLLGVSRGGWAQLKGHYLPGFTGLENGTQPRPSITLAVPLYFYTTDSIKNNDGETESVHPEIRATFTGISVMAVTKVKVFGANWGFQAMPADTMKSRIEGRSLDVSGSFGFSDITFTPVWLGWHKSRVDFTASWSFFAPTGRWEFGATDNAGLGMWSNDFQAGTTVHLDNKNAWSTSVLGTYEIHSHKRDSSLKVGDIFTFEGGTGRTFRKPLTGTKVPMIFNLGAVYYGQFKVTSDSSGSTLTNALVTGIKDRVFGIGGEANVFLPKAKTLVVARILGEIDARNRSVGTTFIVTAGYQLK